ncbi:S8 family serine peptidase [Pseudoalteromonas sp. MMG010]|uniref:S8 family serine peptidase n=1 Tax=Pseudoalteromonas sp. MMG010 TaxID=2822685 RepID=UPI001B3A464E|nr:S8 family serine peptidase [Pseudoalteromonas sp. MMG010]MBQ4832082.1 S8 family serine peptidase [Pseudoalteromonas sp. MMG010]
MNMKYVFFCLLVGLAHTADAELIKPIRPIIQQVEIPIVEVKRHVETLGTSLQELELLEQASQTLAALPPTLNVLNRAKQTVFVEVEVEQGFRAIEREWIILADQKHQLTLDKIGATILTRTSYDALNLILLRFVVPEKYDSKVQLLKLLSLSEDALIGRNHIYQAQSGMGVSDSQGKHMPLCDQAVSVGMIDSAVAVAHSGFAHTTIKVQSFLPETIESPSLHGTAVAGVMVGKEGLLTPLLNKATLYSAAVFHRQSDFSQGATLIAIVQALNWLVAENVPVINMSFTGPNNAILAAAIKTAHAKKITLVGAAGNAGPAALPLYPAAYNNVIAVSAVGHLNTVYRWSNKGEHIDFSAPGVNVLTLNGAGGTGRESGTSMAAPYISAAAACLAVEGKTPQQIFTQLVQRAVDAGQPGKDPVFGYGIIRSLKIQP